MTGIRLFNLLTAKRRPLDPNDISDVELLRVILGTPAADSVMKAVDGELSNLSRLDLVSLAGQPNIGEGRAGQLAALYLFSGRLAKILLKSG